MAAEQEYQMRRESYIVRRMIRRRVKDGCFAEGNCMKEPNRLRIYSGNGPALCLVLQDGWCKRSGDKGHQLFAGAGEFYIFAVNPHPFGRMAEKSGQIVEGVSPVCRRYFLGP